jgi:hypothetical protein
MLEQERLINGVIQHQKYGDDFQIPSAAEKSQIRPGVAVRVMFELPDGRGVRLWLVVTDIGRHGLPGGSATHTRRPSFWGTRVIFE